jgi:AraC-like DNA-binding protein
MSGDDPADGGGQLSLRPAEPRLRPLIGDYEGYVERAAGFSRRRQVPGTSIVLIALFDGPLGVSDPARGGEVVPHTAFVAGLDGGPAFTEFTNVSSGIQLNLNPIAARMLFGMPMHELAHRVIDLGEALGPGGPEYLERLRHAREWEARFAITDAFILRRLARADAPAEAVAWAFQRLARSGGRAPIASICEELGWSRKRLVTEFRDHVGLPPKLIGSLFRFERAQQMLRRTPVPAWAEIAQACGYYDQAHFTREFRRFAGTTPTSYLGHRLADGWGVEAGDGA